MAAPAAPLPAASRPLPNLLPLVGTTLLACIVAVSAGLNLYLLEDGNPLSALAYAASPAARFSYDAAYLSGLVAGVGLCGVLAAALLRVRGGALRALLAVLGVLVALGGFGGLVFRHPTTFLGLLAGYAAVLLVSLQLGWWAARRVAARTDEQTAAVLESCGVAAVAVAINVGAVVVHTLALNPANHALFMQGQIGTTHFSALLIAMALDLLALVACLLALLLALRRAGSSRA